MPDTPDRRALREIAEAATPGEMYANTKAALRFRGTFDPPTVLALLDALDAAEADAAHLQDTVDHYIARVTEAESDRNQQVGRLGNLLGEERDRAAQAEAREAALRAGLTAWCDKQDALSKGEPMTTRQVRALLAGPGDAL